MNVFIEGQYVLTFCGGTSGAILFSNMQDLRNGLQDIYPNPGDPTLAFLLTPSKWTVHYGDDMPFHVETRVVNANDDYRISITRLCELE